MMLPWRTPEIGTGLTLAVLPHCWDEPTFVQAYGTTELDPLRTFAPLRCHCSTGFHEDERSSSDELVDVVCPKPVPAIVGAALLDAREHIVEPDGVAIRVDIDHGAIHLE